MGELGDDRRARVERARLYLVCDARPEGFLRAALAGGVDVLQLRDKAADDAAILRAAEVFRACCDDAGALFVVNDRPDLAVAADADGVHVGQGDAAVEVARAVVGEDRLIGRSTHSPEQLEATQAATPETARAEGGAPRRGVDYVAVGPVYETPTKPGRPAVGLEPVRYAAARARVPWFAIGGIAPDTIGPVLDAGARRVVVVRAIAGAADPEGAARALRAALDREEAPVGPA
ncbi:MAG: thiamine-phosphate pyrophosphorylase [Solirubrobacteraceae bacterium]|jgi:thiamine-phosphate pyrophosphorylase|nr:thiamine-phosphate pyrophosphorylase [Solirubrobacteraceae bacterium]